MRSHFFALLNRMRLIRRWSLMRNLSTENIAEHCFEVGLLAHNLALLRKIRFAEQAHICPDPNLVLSLALYHDAPEIITGDLPTPVKYANPDLRQAFQQIEDQAVDRLLLLLPKDLRPAYTPLLRPDRSDPEICEALKLVHAADKLSAWLKCDQEVKQGNTEFVLARETLAKALDALNLPEVQCFRQEFAPSYGLPLDALQPEEER